MKPKTLWIILLFWLPIAARAQAWNLGTVATPWLGQYSTACEAWTMNGNSGLALLRLPGTDDLIFRFWQTGWNTGTAPINLTFGFDNGQWGPKSSGDPHDGQFLDHVEGSAGANRFINDARTGLLKTLHVNIGQPPVEWQFSVANFSSVYNDWKTCIPQTNAQGSVTAQLPTLVGLDWQSTDNDPAFKAWLTAYDASSGKSRQTALNESYNLGNAIAVAAWFNQYRAERLGIRDTTLAPSFSDNPSAITRLSTITSHPNVAPLVCGAALVLIIGGLALSTRREAPAIKPFFVWGSRISRIGLLVRSIALCLLIVVLTYLVVEANALPGIIVVLIAGFWCQMCLILNRFEDMGWSRWHIIGFYGTSFISYVEPAVQPGGEIGAVIAVGFIFALPNLAYIILLLSKPSVATKPPVAVAGPAHAQIVGGQSFAVDAPAGAVETPRTTPAHAPAFQLGPVHILHNSP